MTSKRISVESTVSWLHVDAQLTRWRRHGRVIRLQGDAAHIYCNETHEIIKIPVSWLDRED